MCISKQLYAGQYAAPKRAEVLRKLQHGGPLPSVHVPTRTVAKEELIDIYAMCDSRSETVRRDNPLLVGIIVEKKEAFQVVQTIITELYVRNGIVNTDASFDINDT